MNRRSFFSSLAALAGAASLSPNIFIPKFEPVKWKVPRKWIRNPDWVMAEYRMIIYSGQPYYDKMILHRREPEAPILENPRSLIQVRDGSNNQLWGEWKFETP